MLHSMATTMESLILVGYHAAMVIAINGNLQQMESFMK